MTPGLCQLGLSQWCYAHLQISRVLVWTQKQFRELCCAMLRGAESCCAVLSRAALCQAVPVLCCAVPCCAVLSCAALCQAVPVLCCAVLCCAVLCCAVLCCAVLCYAAFYGHVPMHLALAAAFFLSVKHVQHEESLVSTRPEEHLRKTYSKT